MALIKCPECEKDISSLAEVCPHCGYPISKYLMQKEREEYIKNLTDKIIPCDFQVPPPRKSVCIKCGHPYSYFNDEPLNGKPRCKCGMPTVEIDYPEQQSMLQLTALLYIHDNIVIPRNIGDKESEEYKSEEESLYRQVNNYDPPLKPEPPDPKYYGKRRTDHQKPLSYSSLPQPSTNIPVCPICKSTNLTKLSSVGKAAKIFAFGIFGADSIGKTWRCNNCGSKF